MYLPIDASSSAQGWNYGLGWGHAGWVGKGEKHPAESGCLVYQLGSNVEDLVNGELISCLFSPSFPIEDVAFEPWWGRSQEGRDKVWGARRTMQRADTCARARVCVQTCMRLTVNNVARRPTGVSAGGCFCQHAHVSHRGPRLVVMSERVYVKSQNQMKDTKGASVQKKRRRKEIWKGDMSNFPQTTAADQVIRVMCRNYNGCVMVVINHIDVSNW